MTIDWITLCWTAFFTFLATYWFVIREQTKSKLALDEQRLEMSNAYNVRADKLVRNGNENFARQIEQKVAELEKAHCERLAREIKEAAEVARSREAAKADEIKVSLSREISILREKLQIATNRNLDLENNLKKRNAATDFVTLATRLMDHLVITQAQLEYLLGNPAPTPWNQLSSTSQQHYIKQAKLTLDTVLVIPSTSLVPDRPNAPPENTSC